jgi:hypothetical protein
VSAVQVRIPPDRAPSLPALGVIAAVALLAGLWIAWWGMDDERSDAGQAVSAAGVERPREAGSEPEAEVEPASEAEPEPESESEPESEPESESESESGSESESESEPAAEPAAPLPPPREGGLRVRRGRVAYLHCEGLRRCPRDEALEAAVWPILEQLASCPDGPDTAGEADLRIDYTGDAAPEIAWRDTFPTETVRLEEARVLGCLRQPLAATRQSVGASRLIVSFRFALE